MSSQGFFRHLPALVLGALCAFATPGSAGAEPVEDGHEKWILQLLIDHRLPPGHERMPLVDWDTGMIIPG